MMNSKYILLFSVLFLISFVSAADLEVIVLEKNEIIITELERTNATFKLSITNNGDSDEFQIYSLVSVAMHPKEFFKINHGETLILDVVAVPFKEIISSKKGIYAFEYQIKGKETGFFKDTLALRIFDVKDAVAVTINDIPLNATKVEMILRNKENIKIDNIKIVVLNKK